MPLLAAKRAGDLGTGQKTGPLRIPCGRPAIIAVALQRDRPFDNEAFFAALDSERASRSMNWRAVAKATGVSSSTLTRIGQGRRPDIDSFAALASWANVDPEAFFRGSSTGASPEPLTEISVLLRADPNLSSEAAAALDELVKATYERLRKPG